MAEVDTGRAAVVAEVRVAEIGAVRGMNPAGAIPTRDPNVQPGQSFPSVDKLLYAPIRLEVIHFYKGGSPGVDELLTVHYAGTTADRADYVHEESAGIPLDRIHVGDQAMVFGGPVDPIAWSPDYVYIRNEAERLGSSVEAFDTVQWYQYADGNAIDWTHQAIYSIEVLRAKVEACVAIDC